MAHTLTLHSSLLSHLCPRRACALLQQALQADLSEVSQEPAISSAHLDPAPELIPQRGLHQDLNLSESCGSWKFPGSRDLLAQLQHLHLRRHRVTAAGLQGQYQQRQHQLLGIIGMIGVLEKTSAVSTCTSAGLACRVSTSSGSLFKDTSF